MTKFARLALILCFCALLTTAHANAQGYSSQQPDAPQQAPDSAPATAAPKMLRAGIEHSESVQPLEPQLMPGQRFNLNAVQMAAPIDEWIEIPGWLAGTFEINSSLVVQFINYQTGQQMMPNRVEKIYRTFSYGHQLDSTGHVWHLNRVPYRNSIEAVGTVQYNLIRRATFLHVGNDSVLESNMGPALVVAKDTGIIKRSTTIETFGKFEPDATGIRKTISIKGFNPRGMPEDLIVRIEQGRLLEQFRPDPSTAESFQRFMAARAASAQGYPSQGMSSPGYPAQRYPMQGAPAQGYPAQRYPMQGAPVQGYPAQGYPTQGAPVQAYPGQYAPAQNMPMQNPAGQAAPYGQMQPQYQQPSRGQYPSN